MKPKKLIEVAMPIKEISAESVRDKSIRHGHISTLHLWWARRPLPACRAIVFASLIPDPNDENTPQAFKDAVSYLLDKSDLNHLLYKPYDDIPYTAIVDPMEDNLRNRLMMFIGKFSDKCQKDMIAGKSTPPKEQLTAGSLVKWESKNDPKVLRIARELIWVAYNSDLNSDASFERLHREFDKAYDAIPDAEQKLYSIPDRHLGGTEVEKAQQVLDEAIAAFQSRMPSVFDPFAGGGAIPLEAARLGCRSYGNDINPVAHIIERASAEFPQKYGKPITFTLSEFRKEYGEDGIKLAGEMGIPIRETIEIPNQLVFDVEFYALNLIRMTSQKIGFLFPSDEDDNTLMAYYWVRTTNCSNPSCHAQIPLIRQFNLSKRKNGKGVALFPSIEGNTISFKIKNELNNQPGWNNRGSITCPCCGSVTSASMLRTLASNHKLEEIPLCAIYETKNEKKFRLCNEEVKCNFSVELPSSPMAPHTSGGDISVWGFKMWGDMFSTRQKYVNTTLVDTYKSIISNFSNSDYYKAVTTYLSVILDKYLVMNTNLSRWNETGEFVVSPFSKQAVAMTYDYPEPNPFCNSSGSLKNQIDWVIRYIKEESPSSFGASFVNASSGEITQFLKDEITCTVTDPPYYDAIAYADISDFFYLWLKATLGEVYPLNFATPQTPKKEECTALKHYHQNNRAKADKHFEQKLTQIFGAIEYQTKDIVSIMFAHQSTQAWTTLCNSIIEANMNITGSWPMDSERAVRTLALAGSALESSVTVACRPSQRQGFGEFKEVKRDIERKVKEEVDSLYELGFRGADLLTACFGQAVSEFGKYESVEKADGSEVSVAELLEMARQAAFDALLKGIKADDITRFYIGWLQLNGMGECDFDDATKFTRVGVNVEINDIISQRILIRTGNKVRLATAEEHISGHNQGFHADQPIIDQVHRVVTLFRNDLDKDILLKLIKECAPNATDSFWRVLASLKELMPANEDLKAVQGLLQVQETLRVECQKDHSVSQGSLFEFE